MNTAMLDYDEFTLDTVMEERLSLPEAIQKAEKVRSTEPEVFVRIKRLGPDAFTVVRLSAHEVNAYWMARMQTRLEKMARKRVAK